MKAAILPLLLTGCTYVDVSTRDVAFSGFDKDLAALLANDGLASLRVGICGEPSE